MSPPRAPGTAQVPLALWAFVVTMVAFYVANVIGPPPPNARALATVAFLMWLFVPWAYWIDRHREVRATGGAAPS
jgi:hypothetical protein